MSNEVNSSNNSYSTNPAPAAGPAQNWIQIWITANPIIAGAIITGVIGGIFAIIVALIPHVFAPSPPTPTPPPTSTSSPVSTDTPIPHTDTPSPTVSPTSTPTITVALSETITLTPAPILVVLMNPDKFAGKPPLTVKFDARESYLIASNGEQFPCKFGNCDFTWKVTLDGQQLDKSQVDSSGRFQFTFGRRGRYLVSVMVCRGKEAVKCDGNGVYIEVG